MSNEITIKVMSDGYISVSTDAEISELRKELDFMNKKYAEQGVVLDNLRKACVRLQHPYTVADNVTATYQTLDDERVRLSLENEKLNRRIEDMHNNNDMLAKEIKRLRAKFGMRDGEE